MRITPKANSLQCWHARGKLLYQQNEAERAKRLTGTGRRDGIFAAGFLAGESWAMLDPDAGENLGQATLLDASAGWGNGWFPGGEVAPANLGMRDGVDGNQ